MTTEIQAFTLVAPEAGMCFDFTDGDHPSRIRWKHPGETLRLEDDGTHFLFCPAAPVTAAGAGRSWVVEKNCYACLSGAQEISGGGALISSRLGWRGLNLAGGPVEDRGRLKYVSGCTSTVLLAPPVRGDACLHLLHVPADVNEAAHTHPTLRVGYVMEGRGIVRLADREMEMRPHTFFCLPPDILHSFHTDRDPLRMVMYHPDSTVGPSDEDNTMLNRTIIGGTPAHLIQGLS